MSGVLASLGFNIDSSQAQQATQHLNDLRGSADALAKSHEQLIDRTVKFQQANADLSQSVVQLRQEFRAASDSLDTLLQRYDQLRSRVSDTQTAFNQFNTVKSVLDGVANSMGTTADATERFFDASQRIGLTTQEATLSLQRFTDILNNLSASGRAARAELTQLAGVDFSGLGSGDQAELLRRTVAGFQQNIAQGPDKFRLAQQIFGFNDPLLNQQLNQPQFVSFAEQQRIANEDRSKRIGNLLAGNNQLTGLQNKQDDLDFQDLSKRFNINFVTGNQQNRDILAQSLPGLFSADPNLSSRDSQLQILRFLRDNPTSSLANESNRLAYSSQDSFLGRLVFGDQFGISDSYRKNILPQLQTYNEDQLKLDSKRSAGVFDFSNNLIARNLRYYGRNLSAETGSEKLPPGWDQPAPEDALGRRERLGREGDAISQTLGDPSFSEANALDARIALLQPETVGKGGKLSEALVDAFGTSDGYTYAQRALSTAQYQRGFALTPGGSQIQDGQTEAYILRQPAADQPRLRQLLDFARSRKIDPGQLIQASGQNGLSSLLDGQYDVSSGLSRSEIASFNTISGQGSANDIAAARNASAQLAGDQSTIRGSIAAGPGAVQETTTRIQAYNEALQKTGDTLSANAIAEQKVQDLREQARTATDKQTQALKDQTDAQDALTTALQKAGNDPYAQALARASTGVDAQVNQFSRNNPAGANVAGYRAQVLSGIGSGATADANTQLSTAQRQLQVEQQLVSVAGQRSDIQAKAQRDSQIDLQFAKDWADAYASGGQKAADAIIKTREAVKQLADETAAAKLNADALNNAFALNQKAGDTAYYATLNPVDRALAQQRTEAARSAGVTGAGPGTGSGYDNNVGNIKGAWGYPGETGLYTGTSGTQFDTFSSQAAGFRAVGSIFQKRVQQSGGNLTFEQFLNQPGTGYAPASDGNDVPAYVSSLSAGTGLPKDANISNLLQDPQKLANFLMVLARHEKGAGASLSADSALAGANSLLNGTPLDLGKPASPDAVLAGIGGNAAASAQDAAVVASYQATIASQRGDLISSGAYARGGDATSLALARQGQTGLLSYFQAGRAANPAVTPNADVINRQAQGNVVAGQQQQFATDTGNLQRDIEMQKELGDAYLKGGDAVSQVTQKYQVLAQARQLNLSDAQKEQLATLTQTDAYAKQGATIDQQVKSLQDKIAIQNAQLSQGPIGSAADIGRAVGEVQYQQTAAANPGASKQSLDQLHAALITSQQNEKLISDQDQIRQGFNQITGAAVSSFETLAQGGVRANAVMGQLLRTIENIVIQSALVKPFENAVGNGITNLFNLGGSAAAGSASTLTPALSVSNIGLAAGPVAAGGFVRRIAASGSVLDRPTSLDTSNGPIMAGEAGIETILPLTRDASGNLGVRSSGGGSGATIIAHTPITIQNGGNNGQGMSQDSLAKIQMQIDRAVRTHVKTILSDEMRPGGIIYGATR